MLESRRQQPAFMAQLAGRYQLLGLLGKGGMGAVYRALEVATGREVALKALAPELAATPTLVTRLQREAELLARVEHPGVVRVLASWVGVSGPVVVMELVEGGRPIDVAWRELDLRRRVALVRDAAVALGAAHRAGVVHRDVKPGNLLVDARGKVRVLDFGVAISDDLDRLTRSGLQVGTPQWMAPEQFAGLREAIGPPSDVWALGVVLYQALSGGFPFPGPGLAELAVQVAGGQVRPLRGAPRALEAICRRCLASAPCDRYPDGGALAVALDDWLEGRTREPRRLWPAIGAALLLLGGGALLASGVLRPAEAPPPPPAPAAAREAVPAPRPGPDPETLARGDGALRRAQREKNPVERRHLLRRWLVEFAAHPRRTEVEEELRVLAITIPVARLQLPAGNPEIAAVGERWAVWTGEVRLLEFRDDELVPVRTWPNPGASVRRLMAARGQDRLYAADRGGALLRFELEQDGPPARRTAMPLRDAALAARDGRDLLAVCDGQRARVFAWGEEALELVYETELGGDTTRALELSSDGRWLLYSHGSSGPLDGSHGLELYPLDGGERHLQPSMVASLGVGSLPDRAGFVAGDQVGGVSLLVREGEAWAEKPLRVPTGNTIRGLCCGRRYVYAIATTHLTGILDQFDPPAPDGTRWNRTGELPGRPARVALSPDERFVAVLVGKPTPEDGNELLLFQVEE